MGGYLSTPIPVKKYIRIPDRRLISGFLHINVVSHSDNDDKLDAYQYYRDTEDNGGMDNRGSINVDYKVNFAKETRKPSKVQSKGKVQTDTKDNPF